LFLQQMDIDPHTATVEALTVLTRKHIELNRRESHRETLLDLLYSQVIEPRLQEATFIHDYPASMAALARVASDAAGTRVAQRFELVIGGMEIANGYDELVDAAEQQRRFTADQKLRRERGQAEYPVDQRLLAAMAQGLPACAGVALGVDRLLMLQAGVSDISAVLAFPHERA
jgi:lysyl-tRNA synthetase class 2